MNYFLTRRHYARVAVVPPPLFCGKTWRTRVSLTATGLFLFFLPHHHPHTLKRVLFMSRQARRSRPTPPFSPAFFSFCVRAPAAHREAGRSVRDTVSLTLLLSTSFSLRCPGETVIDVRPAMNRERERESFFFPLFTLSSGFSSVSLVARDMEARRRWINLSNGGDPSRLMKSRVKCRIERAGIKYLLGRCVVGKVVCVCVCVYILGWFVYFPVPKGWMAEGLSLGSTRCYTRASFNKNAIYPVNSRMLGNWSCAWRRGWYCFG